MVTPIASPTTINNAVLTFSSTEACQVLADAPYASVGSVEVIVSTVTGSGISTATLTGMQSGGSYSFEFLCEDQYGNQSNSIQSGVFNIAVPVSTGGGGGSSYGSIARMTTSMTSPTTTTPTTPTTIPKLIKTLKLGVKGDQVKLLQQMLNKKGFTIATTGAGSMGNESNVFATKTKSAVVKFQKANGLKPDGVVGPKTWALLQK